MITNRVRKTTAMVLWCACALMLCIPAAQADITTGLVGWWKFDEGSGTSTSDASGNNNTGTLVNFPSDNSGWVQGEFSTALQFNGSNRYVTVPKVLANKSEFTISVWARDDGDPAGEGALMGNSIGGFYIRKGGNASSMIYYFPSSAGGVWSYASHPAMQCGAWLMHTFTMTPNGVLSYYLNGMLLNSVQGSGWDYLNSNTDNWIGQYARDSSCAWNGLIDTVRIYNRALSAAEVQSLYSQDIAQVSGPPQLSQGLPTGTLPAATTQTALTVVTNKTATCKCDTGVNTPYSAMATTFTLTGGLFHSTTLTGLARGATYTYYIACQDASGAVSAGVYPVSFSIAAQSPTPLTIPPAMKTPAPLPAGGYALAQGPYSLENRGSPLQTNTQEHQVMYRTNDGHRHLQMYYDTFGAQQTELVDFDLETNAQFARVLDNNFGRPGTGCHVFYPGNNKFYLGSDDPGSMSEFDPANGETRYVHGLCYKGAQYCDVGDDGWIYLGEVTSNVAQGAGLERYNPLTDTWQNLGVLDPSFTGGLQYAYTLGADSRYVYVGLGELPWYLAVYDTQASASPVTLFWADQGDTCGTVSKGSDGKWYYTRFNSSTTWYRKDYRLENGVPVEVTQVPTLAQWYDRGNTISDKSAFDSLFHTHIDLDNAYPNSGNNDTALIGWQVDSNPWHYAAITGLTIVPSIIKRIYAWPGDTDTFFGWAYEYGLVFIYNAATQSIQPLGYPQRSLYDAAFDETDLYLSGYPASTLRYDTTQPWTLSGSTIDINSDTVNPYQLTLSGSDASGNWAGKYYYYSDKGADGFIYIGTHHERSSVGGGLGWYNPVTGASNGLRAPFLENDVRDVLAVNNGTKIVYSSNDRVNNVEGKLFVLDVATKQIERIFSPAPNNIAVDKIAEVEPGVIIGLTDSKQYFKANVLTGEIIWVKNLGGTAFPNVGSYDRRLVKGPDGYVWLFIDTYLSRINPADGSIERIMTAPVASLTFNGPDLYFYGGTTISRIKNILVPVQTSVEGDLSGDGNVTSYDAALALQQGRGVFEAAQIGMQAVGLF